MKCFVISILVVGAMAELPRFQPTRFRFQRQELAPTTTDSPVESTTDAASGPYPPSGWRPTGDQFTLPQGTTVTSMDTYGPPAENGPYPPSGWKPDGQAFTLPQDLSATTITGVPDNTYGSPSADATTTDNPRATVEVQKTVGTYYVLLPNGELRRVELVTDNDIQDMRYTARFEMRDRAPLYVFGS